MTAITCIYKKLKLIHYTPWRRLGEEEILYLLIIIDFGTRWGESSASRPGRALAPIPIVQEAGWAPKPVWTQRLEEKSICLCRGSKPDHSVFQSVF
jgi:hypothetical protein